MQTSHIFRPWILEEGILRNIVSYFQILELRKLASFVDDTKDFKYHFGRLLFVLSTDVVDGLLCTLVQFNDPIYRCFTFSDYQLLPTMEEYAYLLGIPVFVGFLFVVWKGFWSLKLL